MARSAKPSKQPRSETKSSRRADSYAHPEATSLLRPDVGTQAQFRKKKPPATYRYDSSLCPALDWDSGNPARERAEWLLAMIEKAARLPAPHRFEKPEELKAQDGRGLAIAKNAGLGFAIPYLHNGRGHDYQPDFLVRLAGPECETLILETKGFDPLKDVKRQAAERWVAAVNADGGYGRWRFAMAESVDAVRSSLEMNSTG